MKVHFIAIGGSAMHNLAIALSRKGFEVTGSDDEIFEPSKGRLKKEGILPEQIGWNPDLISADLDAVILGMHARADNPELAKAKELGIEIFSYPEYIYEQSKHKKRVVIGGSHGKTTITSMILHALQVLDFPVDYMVGAQLEGYDCMVKLTQDNDVIILEGDEYLSSPLDRRPKFHLYKPHIALISGIAWDHINVFPSYENYVEQFDLFCEIIEENGVLVYNTEDTEVEKVAVKQQSRLKLKPYATPKYEVHEKGTTFYYNNQAFPLKIFGAHNLQNLNGALKVVEALGISSIDFLNAMKDFTGAGKRLEKVSETPERVLYKDFAHSPSKLKATTAAVKEQYPDRKLVACMELHTFSSLKKDFLPQYKDAMKSADKALVYFSPKVVAHKKLDPITKKDVFEAFGENVQVETETQKVLDFIEAESTDNMVLLMMSSGNFDGIDYNQL
ncbi:peptidoglycan synthetase [Brumimicrobium salinarum]|uniref:Peptidoglycan synthetase n=1 Tax=Brumimicrobium salinarum TaxID=2058658 RepID=A0A2I0R378_9FLAO|nr:Mur ligase family protein [Brumimicrobium salinarum]PKR80850.1 peptidoglycan synthetase [Brumimicrobium salinarum]